MPSEAAYSGPAITLETSNAKQVVVVDSPGPGWTVTVDWCVEARRNWVAMVTLREPDPVIRYEQVRVTQRVDSGVGRSTPLRVYARVVPYSDQDSEAPYLFAVETGAPSP